MKLLQRLAHNNSAKADPPEIYNWRVLLVSFVVSRSLSAKWELRIEETDPFVAGMWRRTPLRHGYGHHWRRADYGYLQAVSSFPSELV